MVVLHLELDSGAQFLYLVLPPTQIAKSNISIANLHGFYDIVVCNWINFLNHFYVSFLINITHT